MYIIAYGISYHPILLSLGPSSPTPPAGTPCHVSRPSSQSRSLRRRRRRSEAGYRRNVRRNVADPKIAKSSSILLMTIGFIWFSDV